MKISDEWPRRKSIRLSNYDYKSAGLYYITICNVKNSNWFGRIDDKAMQLSSIGKIAEQYWKEIPLHYSNVRLHAFIIMPDHMHGIIELSGSQMPFVKSVPCQTNKAEFGNPQSNSVSMIMNQFKSSVKRWCNKNQLAYFKWQSRFYDHIIDNYEEYVAITDYIINNPARQKTKFNIRFQ